MHFWPYIGKSKMCLGVVSSFFFSCLFTIFSCLFTIFSCLFPIFQNTLALSTLDLKCIFSELNVANSDWKVSKKLNFKIGTYMYCTLFGRFQRNHNFYNCQKCFTYAKKYPDQELWYSAPDLASPFSKL